MPKILDIHSLKNLDDRQVAARQALLDTAHILTFEAQPFPGIPEGSKLGLRRVQSIGGRDLSAIFYNAHWRSTKPAYGFLVESAGEILLEGHITQGFEHYRIYKYTPGDWELSIAKVANEFPSESRIERCI